MLDFEGRVCTAAVLEADLGLNLVRRARYINMISSKLIRRRTHRVGPIRHQSQPSQLLLF
jgi:hypothetical protein